MKVDELEGVELNFWVAKAEGVEVRKNLGKVERAYDGFGIQWILFTVDWNFIGPIVDKIDMWTEAEFRSFDGKTFYPARCRFGPEIYDDEVEHDQSSNGSNVLEAIKRCLVKRKYGESIPNE